MDHVDDARVLESRTDTGVCVVALEGSHDVDSAPEVQRALRRGLAGGHGLIIDLSPAHLVDSVVLGHIIAAHRRGRDGGTPVAIVAAEGTPPVVRNLLRLSGIANTVDVFPELAEAVHRLVAGPQ
jgi:anti-anti-sigma factor